jgi:hypothetical protein
MSESVQQLEVDEARPTFGGEWVDIIPISILLYFNSTQNLK